MSIIIKILRERFNKRVLEYLKRLYKNSQFLVKKKQLEEYRLINLAIYLNIIIRRDINLSSLVNKFTKKFTRY